MNESVKFINCIECNRQISSKAEKCPHCKTGSPKGMPCLVCTHIMKKSESQGKKSESQGKRKDYREYTVHPHCYNAVMSDSKPICKACSIQINRGFGDKACPNCGHPFSIATCYYCKFTIYNIEKAVRLWDTPDYDGYYTYSHSLCVSSRRKSGTNESSGSSNCFIASAVCDPSAKELLVLRSFRDHYLESRRLGHLFLKAYLQLSPPVARMISKKPVICLLVRNLIVRPVAKTVEFFSLHQSRNA